MEQIKTLWLDIAAIARKASFVLLCAEATHYVCEQKLILEDMYAHDSLIEQAIDLQNRCKEQSIADVVTDSISLAIQSIFSIGSVLPREGDRTRFYRCNHMARVTPTQHAGS